MTSIETAIISQILKTLNSKKITASLIVVLVFVIMGAAAPFLPLHDANRQVLAKTNLPPFWVEGGTLEHPLGTDSLGRDILSRLMHGASVALYVAVVSTTLTGVVGTILGLTSGYLRGKTDDVIMRIVDIWMSFPPVILAIALMSVLGTGVNNVVLAIAIVDWTRFTRVVRSEVLSVREKDYVAAAKAIGFSPHYIMWKEIFPNVLPMIIVLAALEMGIAVSVEVLLSFVGFGVKPPTPSWGTMIADGLAYFRTSPYGMLFPLLTVITVVLSLNLLGEGLREKIDPRLMVQR
ncbi:MAG: ABC transporter permease [Candidatus Caldarchaeum sp.]|nr:ABC transporter permease [Candidatus Caldarchaeum sp.]MDW7978127.1 ABC transporter permease [Candidatus Caldarchaeum sp.]MDW8360297.1 ABC transporter permease [Candidatus Caldarchaeum sp.]